MPLATQHQWSRWCIATTSTSCPQAGLYAWGHGPLVLNKFWPVNLEVSCTFSHLILGLGDLKDLEKRNWVGNALTPWGWKFVHTKNKLHTHTQYPSHTVWAMTKTSTNSKGNQWKQPCHYTAKKINVLTCNQEIGKSKKNRGSVHLTIHNSHQQWSKPLLKSFKVFGWEGCHHMQYEILHKQQHNLPTK